MNGPAHRLFIVPGLMVCLLLAGACALQSHSVRVADRPGELAVVFDIDGTLTPRPFAIFRVRDRAASAVQAYADANVAVVYLSARVRMFQSFIPGWLEKHGFAEGSIHVPQNSTDSGDHAAFKQRILEEYQRAGWTFMAAYGDSSTDFEAYAGAGIDRDRVFALRRRGEEDCASGVWTECLENWDDQVPVIDASLQGETP